jgi:hypothetical protein
MEEPRTLDDLAVEFNVSRERVRQIEARAFEKVQAAAKKCIREHGAPEAALAEDPHRSGARAAASRRGGIAAPRPVHTKLPVFSESQRTSI